MSRSFFLSTEKTWVEKKVYFQYSKSCFTYMFQHYFYQFWAFLCVLKDRHFSIQGLVVYTIYIHSPRVLRYRSSIMKGLGKKNKAPGNVHNRHRVVPSFGTLQSTTTRAGKGRAIRRNFVRFTQRNQVSANEKGKPYAPMVLPGTSKDWLWSLANFPQRGDLSLCGSQFDDPYRFRNFVVGSPYGIRIASIPVMDKTIRLDIMLSRIYHWRFHWFLRNNGEHMFTYYIAVHTAWFEDIGSYKKY